MIVFNGRIIRFRGYDPKEKYMHYMGDATDYFIGYEHLGGMYLVYDEDLIEDAEIMQFTGLRDCKRTKKYPYGQDIFEGDIVKDNGNSIGVVKWLENTANLVCFYGGKNEFYTSLTSAVSIFEIKVVGNIYENPELLK